MNLKNISDTEWNLYLKKYTKTYRIIVKEDNHNAILCKFGEISRYSLTELVYHGSFETIRKKNFAIKKLPSYCKITQEGDREFCCKFKETKLKALEKVLIIRKRKKLTPEAIKILRDRLISNKFMHKATLNNDLNPILLQKRVNIPP